ncbi:MAG TPA: YggS family pyridoxal phosphate-dependent enzyme [Candidatus Limnocylindrales bacterium]|nr:YggS family pyridoxal phosphate-dependent enzyme [Candidatus Limnocylindrales bacterium]
MDSVSARLEGIRARIAAAADRSRRDPAGIRIVAVTKGVTVETIQEALALGLRTLGENRIQEALPKIEALRAVHPTWHLIGHLQTNKARQAAEHFSMVESIDSVHLVEALAARVQGSLDVLIEVNVAAEAQKTGAPVSEVDAIARAVLASGRLRLLGLMAIAPLGTEAEAARPTFRRLRVLRDELQQRCGTPLPELSMGMSDDFEAAVEEGASMLRLGRALFAGPSARTVNLGAGRPLK